MTPPKPPQDVRTGAMARRLLAERFDVTAETSPVERAVMSEIVRRLDRSERLMRAVLGGGTSSVALAELRAEGVKIRRLVAMLEGSAAPDFVRLDRRHRG